MPRLPCRNPQRLRHDWICLRQPRLKYIKIENIESPSGVKQCSGEDKFGVSAIETDACKRDVRNCGQIRHAGWRVTAGGTGSGSRDQSAEPAVNLCLDPYTIPSSASI